MAATSEIPLRSIKTVKIKIFLSQNLIEMMKQCMKSQE